MLHRGEASAPHPPSACNRPPNDRSTRTHPGGENHEKPPAKCRKVGATAPKSPTVAVKAWVKGFSAKPSPLTVWASVCLRMEGEAVKGKNEKQWKRVRPPAREKPFTTPTSHRHRMPPSVAARASTRKTPRRLPFAENETNDCRPQRAVRHLPRFVIRHPTKCTRSPHDENPCFYEVHIAK